MPLIWQIPDDEPTTELPGDGQSGESNQPTTTITTTKNESDSSKKTNDTGRVGLIDFLKGPKGVMEMKYVLT